MELLQEYATNDLYLASYLKARGLKLAAVEKDGKRSRFVFHDVPDRTQMVTDFYNDAPFRISAFIHAMQDLKASIHNWEGVSSAKGINLR